MVIASVFKALGPTKLTVCAVDGAVPESVTVSCCAAPTGTGVCVMDTVVIQLGKFIPATARVLIGWLPVLVTSTVPVTETDPPAANVLEVPKSMLGERV